MNNVIYSTAKRPKRKLDRAYNDDPNFCGFRSAVNEIFTKNNEEPMPDGTLYWLWYEAKNFSGNWSRNYSNKTAERLILTLARCLYVRSRNRADRRTLLVMVAWIKKTYPNINGDFIGKWCADIFDPEWAKHEPALEEQWREAQERRRMKKNPMKIRRGRPIEQDGLRIQILKKLKDGRSTAMMLAQDLNANHEAVAAALWRLKQAGEVVAPVKGLYELKKVA